MNGRITKLVTTFGSTWGRIAPDGESRGVFFNAVSMDGGVDFLSLSIGQDVEFEERPDQINGSHAEHVVLMLAEAVKTS
jgi:cold shock CspA family protein